MALGSPHPPAPAPLNGDRPDLAGRAYQAVVTTGIYCRAGCSGQPRQANVRRYLYAAGAEAAGFRPCKRCRPDTGPETPDWVSPSEVVCRAMRLISAGLLDTSNVDALAGQLGVSGRHLRRLFETYVGAPPDAVAQSQRAHFARRLLVESDLPVAEICFASGFNSIRQMNRGIKQAFRATPTELRAWRRRSDVQRSGPEGGLQLRLPCHLPFDWD